jgi:hypothetical protein
VPEEDVLGLADVLLRDGRLIVDTFLQHGDRLPKSYGAPGLQT